MADVHPPTGEPETTGVHHAADAEGENHGHDDHADPPEALGPVDIQAWGAMLIGGALGLIVAICLALSASGGA